MDDAVIDAGRGVRIPVSELTMRFSASGGPGGQHANTANTRVEVVLDIAGSPSIAEDQRVRLLERFGPELRVVSTQGRSQARNRVDALERLRGALAAALVVQPPRRPTRPTRGSVAERRRTKARRSDVKSSRRRPTAED